MHSALVGAKRLECGSLLPPSFYAQTMCLSPYRRPTASSTDFASRRLEQGTIYGPRRNHGHNPNNEPVTLSTAPKHRAVVIALLAAREADTGKLTELAA